jgi:arsenate reductase
LLLAQTDMFINTGLEFYVKKAVSNGSSIYNERKQMLESFADTLSRRLKQKAQANLIFICTHNSRRSHFAQIWAQVAAYYFGVKGIYTFSGGTETTALNERAVRALKDIGFDISSGAGSNPVYGIKYSEEAPLLEAFSKKFEETPNPKFDFYAVMTCSDVDETCPLVPGALQRIPLYYLDPKEADNTLEEATRYEERCFQIAIEMFYLFGSISKQL